MNGSFQSAQEDVSTGGGALTPPNPSDPKHVKQWAEAQGWEMKSWSGIRAVFDHQDEKIRRRIEQSPTGYEELLESERKWYAGIGFCQGRAGGGGGGFFWKNFSSPACIFSFHRGRTPPFRDLSRYVHMLFYKPPLSSS
jgi:hypothetical protein